MKIKNKTITELQCLNSANLCKFRLKKRLLEALLTLVKTSDDGKLFQTRKNRKVIFLYISVTKIYHQAFTMTTQIRQVFRAFKVF